MIMFSQTQDKNIIVVKSLVVPNTIIDSKKPKFIFFKVDVVEKIPEKFKNTIPEHLLTQDITLWIQENIKDDNLKIEIVNNLIIVEYIVKEEIVSELTKDKKSLSYIDILETIREIEENEFYEVFTIKKIFQYFENRKRKGKLIFYTNIF